MFQKHSIFILGLILFVIYAAILQPMGFQEQSYVKILILAGPAWLIPSVLHLQWGDQQKVLWCFGFGQLFAWSFLINPSIWGAFLLLPWLIFCGISAFNSYKKIPNLIKRKKIGEALHQIVVKRRHEGPRNHALRLHRDFQRRVNEFIQESRFREESRIYVDGMDAEVDVIHLEANNKTHLTEHCTFVVRSSCTYNVLLYYVTFHDCFDVKNVNV